MSTIFSSAQNSHAYPVGIEKHYWNRSRNKIIFGEIQSLGLTKILDFGCGSGSFVDFCHERGLEAVGIELSRAFESNDRLYTSIESYERSIHAKTVECLLLLDVIEHIQDPRSLLGNLLERFTSLKYVIVTVPACEELWSNYDEYYGHLLRYNPTHIQSLVSSLPALEIMRSRYLFQLLYLPALILVKKAKRRTVLKAPSGWFQIFIHAILALYFQLERSWLPGGIKGTSLMTVIRRRPQSSTGTKNRSSYF